jgi:hypothetical protein
MTRTSRYLAAVLIVLHLLGQAGLAAAGLYTLAASGTITSNSSLDATIPVGTPWTFELTYDTAAPDLDFESLGAPDPTYGRFTNTASPAALTFFQYKAGSYEVTLDDPTDFGQFSEILITFTSINAIDVNIRAPEVFPHLAGGPVSFHADFNAFTTAPVISSDALPTDGALSPASFNESAITLLPPAGAISSNVVTSFTVTAVPEPATALMSLCALLGARRRRRVSHSVCVPLASRQ